MGRLYSIYIRSAMSYRSETWLVKDEDVIRLERDDARMLRWICSVRTRNRISSDELRTRLKLKSMREPLQDRKTAMVWLSRKN